MLLGSLQPQHDRPLGDRQVSFEFVFLGPGGNQLPLQVFQLAVDSFHLVGHSGFVGPPKQGNQHADKGEHATHLAKLGAAFAECPGEQEGRRSEHARSPRHVQAQGNYLPIQHVAQLAAPAQHRCALSCSIFCSTFNRRRNRATISPASCRLVGKPSR